MRVYNKLLFYNVVYSFSCNKIDQLASKPMHGTMFCLLNWFDIKNMSLCENVILITHLRFKQNELSINEWIL